MSKYVLQPDGKIICDATKASDVVFLEEDQVEETDEGGIIREKPESRKESILISGSDQEKEPMGKGDKKKKDKKTRHRDEEKDTVKQEKERGKAQMEKSKQLFVSRMFLLYRIAAVCLLIVFLGGMFFGTKSLLELGKTITNQIVASENMSSGDPDSISIPVSGEIIVDKSDKSEDQMTTTNITVGDASFELTANEAIVVMVLEYAVGFIAMLMFLYFHKIELKI